MEIGYVTIWKYLNTVFINFKLSLFSITLHLARMREVQQQRWPPTEGPARVASMCVSLVVLFSWRILVPDTMQAPTACHSALLGYNGGPFVLSQY